MQNQGPTATATVTATGGSECQCLVSFAVPARGVRPTLTVRRPRRTVYAKLTDSRLYTGAHRHRFDEDGHGRGAEGRDVAARGGGTVVAYHGGVVADLSQIMREGMRGGTLLSSATIARKEATGSPPALQRSPSRRIESPASPSAPLPRSPSIGYEYAASTQQRPLVSGAGPADETALFHMASGAAIFCHSRSCTLTRLPLPWPFQFTVFCVFGNTSGSVEEMDNSHFAKLCKESGIQGKRVSPASVDIVFNKVKSRGRRTINFDQFKTALLVC